MGAEDGLTAEDIQDCLESIARWGRYSAPATPEQVRLLASQGRFREAFDLIEATAEGRPIERFVWSTMSTVAEGLGLDERAAYYQGRYDKAVEEERKYTERLFEELEAVVRSSCTVQDGMARIIDFCSEALPHSDWELFRDPKYLDLDHDVEHLGGWLEGVFRAEPPPDEIDGLWFGLSNPIRSDETTADMYIAGSPSAANEPETWGERPAWIPESTYARSQVLHAVYHVAYHGMESDGWMPGLGNDAEYALCLAYAGLVVRWLFTTLPSDLLLGGARERAVQVGFDSGDVLRIGTLTAGGLVFPSEGMAV